jgi:hypothetical protein
MFIPAQNRGYHRFTLLTAFIALTWVLLGVYLQITGGCTDWPRCANVTVSHTIPAMLQVIFDRIPFISHHPVQLVTLYHGLSLTVLTCIVLLTLTAMRYWDELSGGPLAICALLIVLACAEIFLQSHARALTQTTLMPITHTLMGFTLLGLLWWLNRITEPGGNEMLARAQQSIMPWAWLSMLLVLLAMLGVAININHIDIACAHLAFCSSTLNTLVKTHSVTLSHATWLQPLFKQETLNLIGYVSLGYLCVFSALLLINRHLATVATGILVLVAADIAVMRIDATGLNITQAILCQTIIISLLLMAMISLMVLIYRRPHQYWSR